MKLTEFFLAELDREVDRSRRALEQVPELSQDFSFRRNTQASNPLVARLLSCPSEQVGNTLPFGRNDGGADHSQSRRLVEHLQKDSSFGGAADRQFRAPGW